jgi:aspartyl-tRNA(Asn)/glutamyl-tRNA(Gln) amidotransferase subunit A
VEREFSFQPIGGLSRLLRRRAISSLELTRAALDALERRGTAYNAVAEITRQLAEKEARRADRLLARDASGSALLGIPYGAKDLLATAGIPTRWGAPPFRNQIPHFDATVIQRLRAAGAVLVGKLAMVELAGGGGYEYASASLHGPGLNPWSLRHWSGGSSSGSASAVAAGLVPFALGSETWGSITTPSAFSGISGLRPSHGAVSRYGAMPLAWSMDKIGPMARSAADCALVLRAIAGRDDRDPTTVDWAFRLDTRSRFTVGVLRDGLSDAPDIARVFDEALRVLRRNGVRLRRAITPKHAYVEMARAILAGETAAAHESFIRSRGLNALVDAGQRRGLRTYLRQPAVEYVRAIESRVAATRDVRALFRELDAVVAPTLLTEAPTLDTNLRTGLRRGGHSVLGAVAGVPAISIPMGFGRSGLPLGLAITADLFREGTALRIAMLFQRETDWHLRRPPPLA